MQIINDNTKFEQNQFLKENTFWTFFKTYMVWFLFHLQQSWGYVDTTE
jgi:hypothetical protein